jgi:hypothetical protein
MLIGIGASIYSGNRYDAAISSANLAARFDAALGITSSGGFASAWADRSGPGRNLLQATGANQPIHLPYDGMKYGWLPGVAGNYFSTPDSVANSITGDIDIRVKAALTDWTPTTFPATLVSKWDNATRRSYMLVVNTDGKLNAYTSADGSALTNSGIASTVATGFADGSTNWVRMTYAAATGKFNFYTSSDGISWTQLGTEVSGTASAIFNSTSVVELGSILTSTAWFLDGKIYAAQIYNGIAGTLAVDFDPSRWTSGTTFTAATGETWTINSTGSKPAQIVDRPSLLFDGAAHFMKCNAFTLNQPETIYLVAKQVTWTRNDEIFDGNADGFAGALVQYDLASPKLSLFAGTALSAENTNLALGSNGVICAVFNGASSSLQINNTTATSGSIGTQNMSGFTLGAARDNTAHSNIQAYEALIYNVAHDSATRANIIRALMSKHGVA